MSVIGGLGMYSNFISNANRSGKAKNGDADAHGSSYQEAAVLNEIKDIMARNCNGMDVRIDYGELQPNGMTIEVTGFRMENPKDINSNSYYSISFTELKKMAEDGTYKNEFMKKIMNNVDEENRMKKQNRGVNHKTTATEETQTDTFINAKGERILVIKTSFGVHYLKIGDGQSF